MRRKAREELEEDNTEAVHVRRRSEDARLLVLGVDVSNRVTVVGVECIPRNVPSVDERRASRGLRVRALIIATRYTAGG